MTREGYKKAVEFLLASEAGDWIMGDGRRCVEVWCEDDKRLFYLTDDNSGELIGTTENVFDAVDFIDDRTRIYREVRHEYLIEDAMNQVEFYLDWCLDIDPAEFADKIDYEYLVARFEKCHDCNVAENDTWQEIIREYIDEHNIAK